MADIQRLQELKKELSGYNATLVAVSKTKPVEEIKQVYDAGHKIFGENYVQELSDKHEQFPEDTEWHFIGHLQTNKIKYIANFVSLIHGVDTVNLLEELNRHAARHYRILDCLLQIYIAEEETKFGLDFSQATKLMEEMSIYKNINVKGFMGMATNTDDSRQITKEFLGLHHFYIDMKETYNLSVLSMGMTSDYKIALDCGSNMVRIGSAIFGRRS